MSPKKKRRRAAPPPGPSSPSGRTDHLTQPPVSQLAASGRPAGARGASFALSSARRPAPTSAPAPSGSESRDVTVRFSGQRLDVEGARTDADAFVATSSFANVQPSSGPIALTHRIAGKASGRWKVTAAGSATARGGDHRNAVRLPTAEGIGRSTFAPVAKMRAPGVVPGSWPLLVSLGFILAMIVLSLLARNTGIPIGTILALAGAAGALGLLEAKAYYRLTHRGWPVSVCRDSSSLRWQSSCWEVGHSVFRSESCETCPFRRPLSGRPSDDWGAYSLGAARACRQCRAGQSEAPIAA